MSGGNPDLGAPPAVDRGARVALPKKKMAFHGLVRDPATGAARASKDVHTNSARFFSARDAAGARAFILEAGRPTMV